MKESIYRKIKEKACSLLRQGEKYTRTDNVYLAKNWSVLNIEKIVVAVVSFAMSIAFARLLTQETFGQYKYILSIISLVAVTALPNLNGLISQSVSQGNEHNIFLGLKTKFKWSFLGSLALIFMAIYYWINDNNFLSLIFLIASPFILLLENFRVYLSYLEGKKLFLAKASYAAFTQVLASSALFTTMILTKNPLILVIVYLLAFSVFRIFFFFMTIKKFPPNKNSDPYSIKAGRNLSFLSVLNIVGKDIDKIITFHFLGAASLAVYAFALAPIDQIRGILKNIRVIATPKLATRSLREIKKALAPKLIKITFFILLVITFYNLIADWVFQTFFPRYVESIFYTRVLSLSLLMFPATIIALIIQTQKKYRELYQLMFILPIIRIALLLILVPKFNLLGLALTEVAMVFVYTILSLFYFLRIK